jgi:ATP-dependent RNA helicase SUPV3L1/SUV3
VTRGKVTPLPNYHDLKESILEELEALRGDGEPVRSSEHASYLLEQIEQLQRALHQQLVQHPFMLSLFNAEFGSWEEFTTYDKIIESALWDQYLFSAKGRFPLGVDLEQSQNLLPRVDKELLSWCQERLELHLKCEQMLASGDSSEIAIRDLDCSCVKCLASYTNLLRSSLFKRAEERVNATQEQLQEGGAPKLYIQMKHDVDHILRQARGKLKRSTYNRLEQQIKGRIKAVFVFPAELAQQRSEVLREHFFTQLRRDGLRSDLVVDDEYHRFFSQLGTNIWREFNYLDREFKKLVKSLLMIKRKDISGTILKRYLGEFWLHSLAREIKRKIIYHMGPTNSGKTYYAIERLCETQSGCYLAPLRLLASELYDTMNSKGVRTSLLTGEEVIPVEGATHYSSTIEMARFNEQFDCCVIDEIQMIADSQRGWAWTRALVNIHAKEIHICGDHTALDLVNEIVQLTGDTLEIKEYQRMTKLEVENKTTTVGDLKRSDALIVFSRRNALKFKQILEEQGFKVSVVYGRLSPEVRREQARKFDQEETDVIVSTDAIAMGMNLPIKRIVFTTLSKFINSKEHRINNSEIKQIGGRAGRYKRFPTGTITCLAKVENGISDIKLAMGDHLPQKQRAMVGPDLDIFSQVNRALEQNSLPVLSLAEFLRLFNSMIFKHPFLCVDLKEMIELAEVVEQANTENSMSIAEIFGFACAPVNLGLEGHLHYYINILNNFARGMDNRNEEIDYQSDNIDYLETSIKCVELYQWLARHFSNKCFEFDSQKMLENKGQAIDRLNELLSDKIVPSCSSCGEKLEEKSKFAICENCFRKRRFAHGRRRSTAGESKSVRRGGEKSKDGKRRENKTRRRRRQK